jgi:hypothetical protein
LNTGGQVTANDILVAQYGLQQLLGVPHRLPSSVKSSPRQALSKQYFDNLQKRQP